MKVIMQKEVISLENILNNVITVLMILTNIKHIKDTDLLIDDLGINWINTPSIICALEAEFNISIPIRSLNRMYTVKDIAIEIYKLNK